jgi:hypothetical protein
VYTSIELPKYRDKALKYLEGGALVRTEDCIPAQLYTGPVLHINHGLMSNAS